MPYPGREHRRGGGVQHVASAGKLGPLAGPGCGAPASQSILGGRVAGRGETAGLQPTGPHLLPGSGVGPAAPPSRPATPRDPLTCPANAGGRGDRWGPGDSAARGRGRADIPCPRRGATARPTPRDPGGRRAGALPVPTPRCAPRGRKDYNSHNAARAGAGRPRAGTRTPAPMLAVSARSDPRTSEPRRRPRWFFGERPGPCAARCTVCPPGAQRLVQCGALSFIRSSPSSAPLLPATPIPAPRLLLFFSSALSPAL